MKNIIKATAIMAIITMLSGCIIDGHHHGGGHRHDRGHHHWHR